MKRSLFSFLMTALLCSGPAVQGKMTPDQVQKLPPPATHTIDFSKEIKPILQVSCGNCHGRGKAKGDFRMDNRETFLKGGDSGSPVIIGKSDESLLIELVMGFDPDNVMPAKGSKLKPEQIALLRAWIDQGLKWDEGVWLGKVEAQNLHPRQPVVPAPKGISNPVDAFVDSYFKTKKVKWPKVVDDRTYARRVYLDITGLLPAPEELNRFVADKSRDKRTKLVDKLLADNRNYAEHWLTFWNDLLRNDYKGTGYIDGGRKQITKWLYSSLLTNKPYDEFVAELVNPTPESEGFSKGIVWRGVVNASQTPQMQAAQSISQVFMGINMKCASCHDSFINDWQLADAYGLANIYNDKPVEMFECDKPTGKMAKTKFLYPEFGEIDADADKPARLKQLAGCITSEKNGRLPRTLVNRYWGLFLGRALVEPVDDMEQAAWHLDLIDWLAEDFVSHNYDVKHLIRQIVTSRTYQLPAVNVGENEKEYVFRGPSVRRLSAEQFRDALTSLTGIGYADPLADVDAEMAAQKKAKPAVEGKWIWNTPGADIKTKAEYVYFRKEFELPEAAAGATAIVICDNSFSLFVNGQLAGSGNDFTRPSAIDIGPFLKKGKNLLAIEGVNHLPGNEKPVPGSAAAGTENPGGLFFLARIDYKQGKIAKTLEIVSDKSWHWTTAKNEGWQKPDANVAGWSEAVELGNVSMQPWRVRKDVILAKLSGTPSGKVRASMVAADPLMVALGRPNREQVVTTRPNVATTLQALELTNGGTISDILKRGAADLVSRTPESRALVQQIYQQALGRKPTSAEVKFAEEALGREAKKEGVEDLLWAMIMLPEFQLIY